MNGISRRRVSRLLLPYIAAFVAMALQPVLSQGLSTDAFQAKVRSESWLDRLDAFEMVSVAALNATSYEVVRDQVVAAARWVVNRDPAEAVRESAATALLRVAESDHSTAILTVPADLLGSTDEVRGAVLEVAAAHPEVAFRYFSGRVLLGHPSTWADGLDYLVHIGNVRPDLVTDELVRFIVVELEEIIQLYATGQQVYGFGWSPHPMPLIAVCADGITALASIHGSQAVARQSVFIAEVLQAVGAIQSPPACLAAIEAYFEAYAPQADQAADLLMEVASGPPREELDIQYGGTGVRGGPGVVDYRAIRSVATRSWQRVVPLDGFSESELLRFVRDGGPILQRRVLSSGESLGVSPQLLARHVGELLGSGDQSLVSVLVELGAQSVPAIVRVLGSGDEQATREAVSILQLLPPEQWGDAHRALVIILRSDRRAGYVPDGLRALWSYGPSPLACDLVIEWPPEAIPQMRDPTWHEFTEAVCR